MIDVTASEELAEQYLDIAEHGLHLISANKVAGSAAGNYYYQVKDAFHKIGRHWLYNATVGAGLPINHTVRDLRESGDDIMALSGISPAHSHGCSSNTTAACHSVNWWI